MKGKAYYFTLIGRKPTDALPFKDILYKYLEDSKISICLHSSIN